MKFLARALGGAVVLLGLASGASGQGYPNRQITFIVPFPAGGVSDNFARAVAKPLGDRLGQSVVVENKPGAGGIIGTEAVANAAADGYTLLYGASGPMATYPFTYKKLPYDPLAFTPVQGVADSPLLLVVRAESPFKTLGELIDFAKKNPEKLNYASTGPGSSQNLAAVLLQKESGVTMTHVPYKGTAPAMQDLLGGRIDFMFDYPVVVKSQIDAGKMRAFGITTEKRHATMPDLPTFVEQGLPGIVLTAWASIVAPPGTPDAIVSRLSAALDEVLKDPAVIKYFNEQGSGVLQGLSKEKFRAFNVAEIAKMKDLVAKAGVIPE